MEALDEWLGDHPDCKFVVIDTLAKVHTSSRKGSGAYHSEYETLGLIKEIADKYEIAILVVHHQRKAKADDVFDTVSGTQAITGAADTLLLLERKRGAEEAILTITGRDIEEAELALTCKGGVWRLLGEASMCVPTVWQKIVDVLQQADQGPSEIAAKSGLSIDIVKKALPEMIEVNQVHQPKHGLYGLCEIVH